MKDDCGCCTLIFTAEAGVKIVQPNDNYDNDDYELVMPSGNRNIWFDDKEAAIYCASVVGSCWLEAEACGAMERSAEINAAIEKASDEGCGELRLDNTDDRGWRIDNSPIYRGHFVSPLEAILAATPESETTND